MENNFIGFITNKYIYVPLILWFTIQLFKLNAAKRLFSSKIVYFCIQNEKIKRIMGAGGMPSSHSAVVTSLATLVGKEYGVNSAMFAITLIFAFVVMYDACGVRRAAGKQAKVLNDIVNTPGLSNLQVREKLQEALGHTPAQVFVGALIGIVAGMIL